MARPEKRFREMDEGLGIPVIDKALKRCS